MIHNNVSPGVSGERGSHDQWALTTARIAVWASHMSTEACFSLRVWNTLRKDLNKILSHLKLDWNDWIEKGICQFNLFLLSQMLSLFPLSSCLPNDKSQADDFLFCLKFNFASGDLCLISIHQYAANVVIGSVGAIMALQCITWLVTTVTSDMTSWHVSSVTCCHHTVRYNDQL